MRQSTADSAVMGGVMQVAEEEKMLAGGLAMLGPAQDSLQAASSEVHPAIQGRRVLNKPRTRQKFAGNVTPPSANAVDGVSGKSDPAKLTAAATAQVQARPKVEPPHGQLDGRLDGQIDFGQMEREREEERQEMREVEREMQMEASRGGTRSGSRDSRFDTHSFGSPFHA